MSSRQELTEDQDIENENNETDNATAGSVADRVVRSVYDLVAGSQWGSGGDGGEQDLEE